MRNFILLFIFLISLCYACSNSQLLPEVKPSPKPFSYFEMSYHGGWLGGFSFCLDSNRQFFAPAMYPVRMGDSIKYGTIPDTLQEQIDTFVALLVKDTALRSRLHACDDCPVVAATILTRTDTIRLLQTGEISPPVWAIIRQLDSFLRRPHQKYGPAPLLLETAEKVAPPPPPSPPMPRKKNSGDNKK